MCEDCSKKDVCKHYHGLIEMTGDKNNFHDGMESAFRDVLRSVGVHGDSEPFMDGLLEIRTHYSNALQKLLHSACSQKDAKVLN